MSISDMVPGTIIRSLETGACARVVSAGQGRSGWIVTCESLPPEATRFWVMHLEDLKNWGPAFKFDLSHDGLAKMVEDIWLADVDEDAVLELLEKVRDRATLEATCAALRTAYRKEET